MKFCIWSTFLPVSDNYGQKEIVFRILSFKVLLFWILWNIPSTLANIPFAWVLKSDVSLWTGFWNTLDKWGVVDQFTFTSIGVVASVFFFCPIILASTLPKLEFVALSRRLKFPRNGKKIALFPILFTLSQLILSCGFWLLVLESRVSANFYIIVTATTLTTCFTTFMFFLPNLFVCSWLDHFSDLCKQSIEDQDQGRNLLT